MAKSNRNSGFERQEAVMGQFRRDARDRSGSEIVKQAKEAGRKQREYQAKKKAELEAQPRMSPRFLTTGK
jgi:hypothetical protein